MDEREPSRCACNGNSFQHIFYLFFIYVICLLCQPRSLGLSTFCLSLSLQGRGRRCFLWFQAHMNDNENFIYRVHELF